MKEICIVEFPSNLGLKEPQPGKEPGVKKLPDWLWRHNLHKFIRIKKSYELILQNIPTLRIMKRKF